MLPQLRTKDEGVGSGAAETERRKPDEDESDLLSAIAGDLLEGLKKGSKDAVRGALEALCMHIQMLDAEQDAGGQ